MAQQDLDRFRELVLEDSALQEQLREPDDVDKFCALVLRLGRERGFELTDGDVSAALQTSRHAWMERWIQ